MPVKRAAIIGAGPSGFYATEALLKQGFEVDLYDALPTPFGLVRAGEGRELKGYAASEGILPGRPTKMTEAATLKEQVERWRQVLVKLAEEFHSGDARVRPKQYPATCEHCGQRLLCRLDVSLVEGDEEDPSSAEEFGRG